jgi:broad specificity phosphatase PhoE
VILGRLDPPLSPSGKGKAAQLSNCCGAAIIVYSSPLRRAKETAERVSPLSPAILDDLSEIGYGDWDGRSWEDIEASDPELARRKQSDWFGVTPPGGEPWIAFRERVRRAGEQILQGPFPAVVVAHAAVNSVLAEMFTGSNPLEFSQEYGEVITLEI